MNGKHRDVEPLPSDRAQSLRDLAEDQVIAGADQTAQDADQTASDADQTASEQDAHASDVDQTASDRDQSTADRDERAAAISKEERAAAYEMSRLERELSTFERLAVAASRGATAASRDISADSRDLLAAARDESAKRRDARARAIDRSFVDSPFSADDQLLLLRAQAASDRDRAAADRERAAADRAKAAADRAHLEAQLRTAHLDDLTGAYRRGMGRLAISNEIERARRTGTRFVLAYLDVDNMRTVNDRDGHAAGDIVLQALVRIIRARLRPFDPVARYGGDEFVCGMSGIELDDAAQRFRDVNASLQREVGCGVSFGLASWQNGESADELTARADAALLEAKPATAVQ